MNKLEKKKISTFFTYYSPIVIVIILVSFSAVYLTINSINEVKNYEMINLFASTYSLKDETLKDKIKDNLGDKVYEVNVYNYAPDDNDISSYYESFGTISDFNILTKNDLDTIGEYIGETFINLSSGILSNLDVANYEFYSYQENNYALKVYNFNDEEYNSHFKYEDYFDFGDGSTYQEYYLLLRSDSVNFGSFSQYNYTDNGLYALEYLLGLFSNE